MNKREKQNLDDVVRLLKELQSSLDLIYAADQRGIKMWQEAHLGNDLVWPDRGKMIFWLLEQLEESK